MSAPASSVIEMIRVTVLTTIIASGFGWRVGLYGTTTVIANLKRVEVRARLCCSSIRAVIAASTSHFLV